MPSSYTQLLYHIVFSTKERRPIITAKIASRLHEYLGGAIRNEGGVAILVNGVADHVHILARLRQDRALSDVLRNIKANSSGWVHREFTSLADFRSQEGYAAFTVSQSQCQRVKIYIANQERRHQKISYRSEIIAILRRHEIAFDERYVLD
jgi:REP element-mobilizing transposase RayT